MFNVIIALINAAPSIIGALAAAVAAYGALKTLEQSRVNAVASKERAEIIAVVAKETTEKVDSLAVKSEKIALNTDGYLTKLNAQLEASQKRAEAADAALAEMRGLMAKLISNQPVASAAPAPVAPAQIPSGTIRDPIYTEVTGPGGAAVVIKPEPDGAARE